MMDQIMEAGLTAFLIMCFLGMIVMMAIAFWVAIGIWALLPLIGFFLLWGGIYLYRARIS